MMMTAVPPAEAGQQPPVLTGFTPAQLHALNDQIASLRQICIQLRQAQNPSLPWARPWAAAAPLPVPQHCQLSVRPGATSAAAPAGSAAGSTAGANKRKAPASARKAPAPKKPAPAAQQPKPPPKKKKAFIKAEESEDEDMEEESGEDSSEEEEEEPEEDSDDVSDDEGNEGADVGDADVDAPPQQPASQLTPSRRSGRRRTSIVSLKDPDSDEELEEAAVPKLAPSTEQHRSPQPLQGLQARPAVLPAFVPLPPPGGPKRQSDDDEEDIECAVCGDGDEVDGNAILLCDGEGCSVAVHQACYGVRDIPAGDWLCDGCAAGLDPAGAHCLLCPCAGGALRPVASLGTARPPEGRTEGPHYVHLTCALWVPDVSLSQPEAMAGVQLDGLSPDRADLTCYVCKQAGGGVIQCAFGRCSRPLHPLCGRQAGHLLALRESDGTPLAFCGLHTGERFAKTRAGVVAGDDDNEEEAARSGEDGEADEEEPPNEFEQQRLRNIARNQQKLRELQQLSAHTAQEP